MQSIETVESSLKEFLFQQVCDRIAEFEKSFGGIPVTPSNEKEQLRAAGKYDEWYEGVQQSIHIPDLALYAGLKRKQMDLESERDLHKNTSAVKGCVPVVTVDNLCRNMREWDPQNAADQPCLGMKNGRGCVFGTLCSQNGHPLLNSKDTAPCGVSFKYDGEDPSDPIPARDTPRRHCVFCIILEVNRQIECFEAFSATIQHVATTINPFSVIAAPQVGGGSDEMFVPPHFLINGNFPIFDTKLIPGYMQRKQDYRVFYPLTEQPDDNLPPEATLALLPLWRIALEKNAEGHDIQNGGQLNPIYFRLDAVALPVPI